MEFATWDKEKCPLSILTALILGKIYLKLWVFGRDKQNCLLHMSVHIQWVSTERGSTVQFFYVIVGDKRSPQS